MINARKTWRKADEKILSDRVNEYLGRGEDIDKALEVVANELGRTVRGCRDHWNAMYKKRRTPVKQTVKTHEYSDIFQKFTASYAELEQTVFDLITENRILKEKAAQLEKIEKAFHEAKSWLERAM